jgi:predicted peptidase
MKGRFVGVLFAFVVWSRPLACLPPGQVGDLRDTMRAQSHLGIPYRLFVPEGYDAERTWPLVLYLHGGAGRGRDNVRQLTAGNAMLVEMFARTGTAFVLAPQTVSVHDVRKTLAVLDQVMATYSIDRSRVYVAGQSLGGYGTLHVLSDSPQRFAAAVVIAAGDTGDARRLARVPIWFFHGEKDAVISVEEPRRLVARIRRAGGTVRYTEYRGEEHGLAWLVVRENGLVSWLFRQAR